MTSSHAEALGRARTAADFAAVIALLDSELNDAVARRRDLEQAEDRAIFGDGDLAAARAALDDGDEAIARIEKAMETADRRRIAAAEDEARAGAPFVPGAAPSRSALRTVGDGWLACGMVAVWSVAPDG